jgi:predicted metal-dependent hydrolase
LAAFSCRFGASRSIRNDNPLIESICRLGVGVRKQLIPMAIDRMKPTTLGVSFGPVAAGHRESPLLADRDFGLGAAVRVRVSARARRIVLRIDQAERVIVLVLPPRMPLRRGLQFLAAQRRWIETRLAALPHRVALVEGATVPVLGVPHLICRTFDPDAPTVALGIGEIRVRSHPAQLPQRVRDYLSAAARAELTRRACDFAARIGQKVNRIGVRDPASRWGSCSTTGNLSFSWRLIMAPEPVLDYVVAHEVAHLAEMNHGRRFWQLVECLAPGSATQRAWLKRHRNQLMAYG